MTKNPKIPRGYFALAAAAGLSVGIAAHAASFDLGRIGNVLSNAGTAVSGINEKDEIAIGRELAGRTMGAAPLVDDPELQSYVNKVGRWIASQSERSDLPWHFGIIDTASINAFAAPGGYILITRGLYELLENESQLAGVLGHEIGHVVKRHHITVIQKQAGTAALAGLAQEGLSARGGRSAQLFNNLLGTGAEVFAKALDKDAEYEADHVGVILAVRAGYSPSGLLDVLQKLQARATESSVGLLFSTHPHPNERLDKLNDLMKPRLSELPQGLQPAIQSVSGSLPPARAGAPAVSGARAMQDDQPQQTKAPAPASQGGESGGGGGFGLDIFRGFMRR